MNLADRMADAMNEVYRVIDDSRDEKGFSKILSVRVSSEAGRFVQMEDVFFLESFRPNCYEVIERESDQIPFYISNVTKGVRFFTLLTAAGIIELKETHPEHFEYIQKELQL